MERKWNPKYSLTFPSSPPIIDLKIQEEEKVECPSAILIQVKKDSITGSSESP
jgi:hypothetical protein